ncbi:hypothetical protein DIPPA_09890 [Diplonema papillatum]|nr:hypothetical protein DIPPA_09890 [Diplonema papillatum]
MEEDSSARALLRRIVERPQIPQEVRAHLGPVDKLIRYGRIPVKLTMNILVVLLLVIEVITLIPYDNRYHNHSTRALASYFTPNEQDADNAEVDFTFYDTPSIVEFMSQSYDTWSVLNESDVGLFRFAADSNGNRVQPTMYLTVKANGTYADIIGSESPDVSTTDVRCTLTDVDPVGPFSALLPPSRRAANQPLNGGPAAGLLATGSGSSSNNNNSGSSNSISNSGSSSSNSNSGSSNSISNSGSSSGGAPLGEVWTGAELRRHFAGQGEGWRGRTPPVGCAGDPLIFEKLYDVRIVFEIDNIRLADPAGMASIRRWQMTQHYSAASRAGSMSFLLTFEQSIVGRPISKTAAFAQWCNLLSLFVLVFTCTDLLLRFKAAKSEWENWKIRDTMRKVAERSTALLENVVGLPPRDDTIAGALRVNCIEEPAESAPDPFLNTASTAVTAPLLMFPDGEVKDTGAMPARSPVHRAPHSNGAPAFAESAAPPPQPGYEPPSVLVNGLEADREVAELLSSASGARQVQMRRRRRSTVSRGARSDSSGSVESGRASFRPARRYDVAQEVAEGAGIHWWELEDSRVQWLCFSVVSDVLIIASRFVCMSIATTSSSVSSQTIALENTMSGLAVMCSLIVMISHLEHQPRFYLLMKTLRRGIPRAMKFVAGCFPILMGYAILGTVSFGSYADRFASLDASFVVLFSLMNGDIIDETFQSIFFESSLFLKVYSRLYLYTYIALFIYAILNILLAIMEDAYFQVKRQLIVGLREEAREDAAQEATQDQDVESLESHVNEVTAPPVVE